MKPSLFIISLLLAVTCLLDGLHRRIDCVNAQNSNSQSRPSPTAAQPAVTTAEELNNLIVMIKSQIGNDESFGAGIIFGRQDNRLYIATANHVIRRGTDEAKRVQVQLRWMPGESKTAELLDHVERDIDLAVLAVVLDAGRTSPELRWDQLADARFLKSGESVYSIGYPGGRPWHSYVTADKFAKNSRELILFESNFIGPGNSGGALLNERRRIVGLIREFNAPDGRAVNIQSVIETLKDWKYPVDLKTVLQEDSIVLPRTFACSDPGKNDRQTCIWFTRELVPKGGHSEFQISLALTVGLTNTKFTGGCDDPHRRAYAFLSCGDRQAKSEYLGQGDIDEWTQDYMLTVSCRASGNPVTVKVVIGPRGCTRAKLNSGELRFREIE
jgi:hypothetical protein